MRQVIPCREVKPCLHGRVLFLSRKKYGFSAEQEQRWFCTELQVVSEIKVHVIGIEILCSFFEEFYKCTELFKAEFFVKMNGWSIV